MGTRSNAKFPCVSLVVESVEPPASAVMNESGAEATPLALRTLPLIFPESRSATSSVSVEASPASTPLFVPVRKFPLRLAVATTRPSGTPPIE